MNSFLVFAIGFLHVILLVSAKQESRRVSQKALVELVGLPVDTDLTKNELDSFQRSLRLGYNFSHKTLGAINSLVIDDTKVIKQSKPPLIRGQGPRWPFSWIFEVTLQGECYTCQSFDDFLEDPANQELNAMRHSDWEAALCDRLLSSHLGIFKDIQLCKVEFPNNDAVSDDKKKKKA